MIVANELLGNRLSIFCSPYRGGRSVGCRLCNQMRLAFDPENRKYVTNLMTLQGGIILYIILYHWFCGVQRRLQIAIVR